MRPQCGYSLPFEAGRPRLSTQHRPLPAGPVAPTGCVYPVASTGAFAHLPAVQRRLVLWPSIDTFAEWETTVKPNYRRSLIAMTATVVIAASAGLVIADNPSRARLVVANTEFSDEQAGAASVSTQSFFYLYEGEYALADHLQGL